MLKKASEGLVLPILPPTPPSLREGGAGRRGEKQRGERIRYRGGSFFSNLLGLLIEWTKAVLRGPNWETRDPDDTDANSAEGATI